LFCIRVFYIQFGGDGIILSLLPFIMLFRYNTFCFIGQS